MAATPIGPVKRYYPKGKLKWVWCPTIANVSAVTRAEINAGIDLSKQVAAWDGWQTNSSFADTPDVNSRFTGKIPGGLEADDSSLTMYLDEDGNDVRQVLPRDETGFVLRMDAGDVPGRLMDVFPVAVGSVGKPFEDDEAVKCVISFAITDEPGENVVIPA